MTTILHVEGMSCEHCVKAVAGAVSALDGVGSVTVELAAKTAAVEHEPTVSAGQMRAAIEEQGYEVSAG